jgi:outer membrane immunogenic protein
MDRMKRLLINLAGAAMLLSPVAAHSADLPAQTYTKAPAVVPPPVFSWTGFYIGGNIGGAWANDYWTDSLFQTNFNTGNNNGVFIGGAQIGGNYQIGSFVIGGEWDFDWASNYNNAFANGYGVFIPALGNTYVVNDSNRWITTVAARFGWAVDHLLLYGKAGGGWVGVNNWTLNNATTGVALGCGNFATNCSNDIGGWLVGAGVEYAFNNNWTVKVEYDYLGLGSRTVNIPATAPDPIAGDTFTSNNLHIQMVKFGVNYLFNWGAPVAARY